LGFCCSHAWQPWRLAALALNLLAYFSTVLGGYMVFFFFLLLFFLSFFFSPIIISLGRTNVSSFYTWSIVYFSGIGGHQQLLFATSRGVWRSYPRCLSTPTLNGILKFQTQTIIYRRLSMPCVILPRCRHCRCCPPLCDNAGHADAVVVIMPAKPMLSL
jgi:hypothetical protein